MTFRRLHLGADWSSSHLPLVALGLLVLARSLYVAMISSLQVLTLHSFWPIDIANVNQAIWNSAHGRLQYCTILYEGPRDHFDPILILFSPVYWLTDNIFWMFLLYSLVVSCGAFAVYALARKAIAGKLLPLLLAVYYLVFPSLVDLNVYRLKGDVVAVSLLLFAFYFYSERRFRPFVVFMALSLLCKESVAIIMVVWGLFALTQKRKSKWVLVPIVVGLCVLFFTVYIYHPHIQGHPYKHIKSIPETLAVDTVLETSTIVFLVRRFFPYYGVVALFSPAAMLMPAPLLAGSLVWKDFLQHEMNFHVLAPVLPFVFVCLVFGTRRLLSLLSRVPYHRILVAIAIGVSSVLMLWQSISLCVRPQEDAETRGVRQLIEKIPAGASVSSVPLALPALSNRAVLHLLVNKDWRAKEIEPLEVDYLLVDSDAFEWSRVVSPKIPARLEQEYFEIVRGLRSNSEFELLDSRAGWHLYRRIDQ